ncbi:MAG: isoprenyl transferase [Deltaproteobacteria bacterium]|nr:isoprenyl transferase [Deltaproteobacteria bacterium]
MEKIHPDKLPQHIAIIMDGNGRWAEKKRLSRVNGHRKGIEAAKDIVRSAREFGIRYLTLYVFSKENWNRPAAEVAILMDFLKRHLRSEAPDMVKNNIRFRAVGAISDLPHGVRAVVREVEEKTKGNDGMFLQLAISYSGRSELADACKKMAALAVEGNLSPDDIDEETVEGFLYTAGMPDPDLLIRTSGERRLSNFLLWQMAYTELYTTDVLWPDFTREDLSAAIRDFQARERRFGLTRDQLAGVAG